MPLAAGVRLGPYQIETWLGAGGMGHVYRATDTRLGRSVAIKVLPDDVVNNPVRRARLAREARAVSCLSHPSICALHDVGEHDGNQFIVMEYLDGETLSRRLQRGALPIADVSRLGAEIASALDHAHHHGMVHRDLKPANIMLIGSGVKVLDFGLAHVESSPAVAGTAAVEAPSATESLTEEGSILGTMQYMAPEQLEGRRVDARTDIFALGAVLYEMATGRPPFEGSSKASTIAAILERTPAPVSGARHATTGEQPASPLLDKIVAKCLAKSPDERWQTASDLSEALTWAAANPYPPTQSGSVPRRWHRDAAWAALSLLVLATVGVIALIRNRGDVTSDVRPQRWLVPAPEGSNFDPSVASFAVSPDGTHLAFVASSDRGGNVLWVRPLDSVVPRRLAEGAAQPFWSSDSRFIAFDGGGQLKKVDLATGLVEPLADAFVQSGSWGRAGALVLNATYRQRRPHGLSGVSASGGQLNPVTRLDPSRAETGHTFPHFLPDGRRFLFLSRSDDPGYEGMLYAASLDSSERVQLFQTRSRVGYASGYLLFARDQTLLAQRFDATGLRVDGDAEIIAEGVERSTGPGPLGVAFSVSDNGVLAYRHDRQTQLVWFDRGGRSLGPAAEPGHYADPDLSPDEQRVAVIRKDALSGQSDVWVLDLTTRLASKLTFGPFLKFKPLWSPDGRRIVYRSGPSLVVKSSDGTESESDLPDNLDGSVNPLDWTPDGRMLVSTVNIRNSTDLWLRPLEGDQHLRPLPHSGSRWGVQAQISPDGRWLAYASNENGRYEVYVRSFPSGDGKWLISSNGGSEPFWRRDGKELFYLAADRSLMAVAVIATSTFKAITHTRLFGTNMSTLVNVPVTRNQYVVTADGQRFLINQPVGSSAAIIVVVDWPAGLKDRR